MPKLRKHSHLNRSQEDQNQNQPSNSAYMGNKSQQSNSLLDKLPLLGRKMKYSQRANRLKQFENRAKVKQTESGQTNSLIHARQHGDKVTMETYFNKFTDDDKESSKESYIMATKPKVKKGLRVSNKFFSNYQLDQGEIDQKQLETDQLLVQKKQVKNACYLLNKVQKKAQNFKNRLQFKNFQQDMKFKQNMKDKLKSLEGCEQVQLLIEVPKVSGKGSHTDAALFLKNVKPTLDASLTNQSFQEVQEEQIPKDRKSFYEGLVKKMKIKKSESITQSILKDNFKKSKLDQNDFIYDFHEKQDSIIRNRNSNKDIHKQIEKPQQSKHIEQKRQEQEINKVKTDKIQQRNEVQNDTISQRQKYQQTNVKEQKSQKIQNKPIKVKKPRKKRRTKKMCIKDLIQEQAEDSDDGFHVNKEDNEEHSNQDGDLSSLIDDSITLCEEDEELAHRKFIKDMMEQQERKFDMLQKKMQEQKMFQNEQLRMRMQAASKRNNQRDQKQAVYSVQQQKKSAEPSEQSISNAKNMQKIKQLQIDLGVKKPVSSQSNPISQRQTVNKSISNIQKLLAIQVADIRKPARNGLKNVGGLKVKQMKKVK